MPCRVIVLAAQKGGPGKTTSCVNLAAALRDRSKKRSILLVDMDPQEDLSAALGLPDAPRGRSMAEVLAEQIPVASILVEAHGMSVAPAGPDLAAVEARLEDYGALKKALAPVRGRFDYIIVDSPRGLGVLTLNCLMAADEAIVAAETGFLSVRQVRPMLESINKVKANGHPRLKVLGVLPTKYAANTVHGQDAHGQLIQDLGKSCRIFTPIPRSVRFDEATLAGKPILDYVSVHPGSDAYRTLGKEVDE